MGCITNVSVVRSGGVLRAVCNKLHRSANISVVWSGESIKTSVTLSCTITNVEQNYFMVDSGYFLLADGRKLIVKNN
jgi:hypothetical protein